MKGRQVGLVLVALIAIGIAGLIIRAVSSGSDELVLSGLLPLPRDVIDKVIVRSEESEAELIRIGDTWVVGGNPVFPPKLEPFWAAVSDFEGAQLIAMNPVSHEPMGVGTGQGTRVSFFLGPAIQEQFIIGKWSRDVRLCYIKRFLKDEVYGIPCLRPDIFDPDPDGWRNPVVVAIPRNEVESVTFAYPEEQFALQITAEGPVVVSGGEEQPANFFLVDALLSTLEVLVSSGFADEQEAKGLRFDVPDALVRVVTFEGAPTPTTSLRFLVRDDTSYYLKTPTQSTVFILDRDFANGLLRRSGDLLLEDGG